MTTTAQKMYDAEYKKLDEQQHVLFERWLAGYIDLKAHRIASGIIDRKFEILELRQPYYAN